MPLWQWQKVQAMVGYEVARSNLVAVEAMVEGQPLNSLLNVVRYMGGMRK